MKPTGASGWGGGTGAKQSLVLLDIHFFYFVFFRFLYPLSKGWFCHIYTFFLLLSTASRERLVQSYIHIPLLISTGSKQRLVQSYILFFFLLSTASKQRLVRPYILFSFFRFQRGQDSSAGECRTERPGAVLTGAGSSPRCGRGYFSQSQLPLQTFLRCPYSPLVQSHASTSVRT